MEGAVSRDEFDKYRKAHHDAMNTVTTQLFKVIEAQDKSSQIQERILALLSGSMDGSPGLTHRVATLEKASSGSWLSQRRDRVVDALLVGSVLTLFALGIKAFIRDAVRDISAVQSPRGTMIPVERDPSTRLALNQEYAP